MRDALAALEGDLQVFFGEEDGQRARPTTTATASSGTTTPYRPRNLGRDPLESAETAVAAAWSTMRDEVRHAFTHTSDGPPQYGPYSPVPIADSYEHSPWPTVGAG